MDAIASLQQPPYEMAADEAAAAGHREGRLPGSAHAPSPLARPPSIGTPRTESAMPGAEGKGAPTDRQQVRHPHKGTLGEAIRPAYDVIDRTRILT
ncbi:hypothetical protein Scel_21460 [Streptomyces cellostaticus]|nr:hypothetical protein Scel_21460 [Streptomyces cellostaticus]